MTERPTWDQWYMSLARVVAQRSRDPSTKVGAVIVRPDKTQVSFGYNDFPRGVEHHAERYVDRTWKYPAIVHAEVNAILNARESLSGCTLYCTFHPCARCAAMIAQTGITCVAISEDAIPDRWAEDMDIARTILREAGVSIRTVAEPAPAFSVDLVSHIKRQWRFSRRVFGPKQRTTGILDHIEKELAEIREAPTSIEEWADVILLAIDGACRVGFTAEEIAEAVIAKQAKNETRRWPDWRTADPDRAIEHVRD